MSARSHSNFKQRKDRRRILAAQCARGLDQLHPPSKRGRRESRMPIAPAVVRTKGARVDHRFNRIAPAFPARMVYGLLRALPGDRLVCHRRLCGLTIHPEPGWAGWISARLDASIGAPGPHDFASATVHAKNLAGPRAVRRVLAKTVCSAVRPRAVRSLTGRPALRSRCAPDAVASIASHRAFVTSRDPPLIRVGRGELVMVICPTC